jgi:hypothetical protein
MNVNATLPNGISYHADGSKHCLEYNDGDIWVRAQGSTLENAINNLESELSKLGLTLGN